MSALNGKTPLMCACEAGNFAEAIELIFDSDLNARDSSGKSAFVYACLNKHLNIVEALVSSGANINIFFPFEGGPVSVLEYACLKGDAALSFFLLANDARRGNCFSKACAGNNVDIILHLLFSQPQSLKRTELDHGLMSGYKNKDVVKILIENGADANFKTMPCQCGMTLLKRVIASNCIDVLMTLLELRLGDQFVNQRIQNNRTILMWAIIQLNTGLVILLLDLGVDVNKIDFECQTSLMHACKLGMADVVHLLLCHHAKTGIRDGFGRTAFFLACIHGHIACATAMLPYEGFGAVDAVDCNNRSILVGVCRNENLSTDQAMAMIEFVFQHSCQKPLDMINSVDSTTLEYTAVLWAIHNLKEYPNTEPTPGHIVRYLLDRGAVLDTSKVVMGLSVNGQSSRGEDGPKLEKRVADALAFSKRTWPRVKHFLLCLYQLQYQKLSSSTDMTIVETEFDLLNPHLVRVFCDMNLVRCVSIYL